MSKEKVFRLFLDDDTHQKLKTLAAVECKTMQDIAVESIKSTISVATEQGKLHKELKK